MPTFTNSQIHPPKSWEEFEEICADLFEKIWQDPNTDRHGRNGQRQNGVDIYGTNNENQPVGVQCKGKKIWPVSKLSTKEIKDEVAKALNFEPPLTEFIIATTAENDVKAQACVRKITEEHKKQGVFSVHVWSWEKIIRSLSNYDELVFKHFGYAGPSLILEEIKKNTPIELIDENISDRLLLLRKKRYFKGSDFVNESIRFSNQILNGDLNSGSNKLRGKALAWCARILSVKETLRAEQLIENASSLADDEEIDIAKAFILAAKEEYTGALKKLQNHSSKLSNSAKFIITARNRSSKEAFAWLKTTQIEFSDLDSDGKYHFLSKKVEIEDWEGLLNFSEELTPKDYQNTPVLYFFSAIANLVQVVPIEFRVSVLNKVPFNAKEFPIATDDQSLIYLRKSRDFFRRCEREANELKLREAANIVSDYALWLELKDPKKATSGKKKLKKSLSKEGVKLRRVNLAIQFGIKLDYDAVNREIDKQIALSGEITNEISLARFAMINGQESTTDALYYIDEYRSELNEHIDRLIISDIEIQLLIQDGQIEEAKKKVSQLKQLGIDKKAEDYFSQIISESTVKDPINIRINEFQKDSSLGNLISLTDMLYEEKDWVKFKEYGEILFEKTKTVKDAERLAIALNETLEFSKLGELLSNYSGFIEQSDTIKSLQAWSCFRKGKLIESQNHLEDLRSKRDHPVDRNLEISLAITSGKWDKLFAIIENEWAQRDKRSASEIIRIAEIAQIVGSDKSKDLVKHATEKSNKNPNILAHAYFIATRAGWENDENINKWLSEAIEKSDLNGNEGPFQRKELREIIEEQPEWNKKRENIIEKIKKGDMPLFATEFLLNRTVIDLSFFPALANPNEYDPRRRSNIYSYSGKRRSIKIDSGTPAFDITTLLTLTHLNILDEVLEYFDKILIPHTTLNWLFNAQVKTHFHQPSRIKDAVDLQEMLDKDELYSFHSSSKKNIKLASQVGDELAEFISEISSETEELENQRLIVRSFPVHRVDSLMEEKADLSEFEKNICSCTSIIEILKEKGFLSASEEKVAVDYLKIHEEKWPNEPEVEDGAILYIDSLSLSYFQHLEILQKLKPAGFKAYIHHEQVNEQKALLRYRGLTAKVIERLEDLRKKLAEKIEAGKIELGPQPIEHKKDKEKINFHPSFEIINLTKYADLIFIDDRSLNGENQIVLDSKGVSLCTSWDLINSLYLDGVFNLEDLLDIKTRLRQAGHIHIPINEEELIYFLSKASVDKNGVINQSAELKILRENILQTQMTDSLNLPLEAPWLINLFNVVLRVLKKQWNSNINDKEARAYSNWLIQFLDIRKWAYLNEKDGGLIMIREGYEQQLMLLILPPANTSKDIQKRYTEWLEDALIKDIYTDDPDLYLRIIDGVKELFDSVEHLEGNE